VFFFFLTGMVDIYRQAIKINVAYITKRTQKLEAQSALRKKYASDKVQRKKLPVQ